MWKYLWDAKPGFVPLTLKQTDQSSAIGSLVSVQRIRTISVVRHSNYKQKLKWVPSLFSATSNVQKAEQKLTESWESHVIKPHVWWHKTIEPLWRHWMCPTLLHFLTLFMATLSYVVLTEEIFTHDYGTL